MSDLWTPPERGTLRVGVTPSAPSLIFKDSANGRLAGFEVECAQRLATRLERELRFVELAWEELIPALERREIDIIMSGMPVTEMRSTRVSFSDSYLEIGQMALVRTADAGLYSSAQDVLSSRARIGVETGSSGDFLVQRYCSAAESLFFPSSQAALNALRDGRIDILIHDAPVVWAQTGQGDAPSLCKLSEPLTSEPLAWAVNKEDRRLLRQVNNALAAWRTDGTLAQMLAHWIPR
ncbi:MAG: transporter substrate-binding domain-containing protein [Thermodesulfobacteriota bacterium]